MIHFFRQKNNKTSSGDFGPQKIPTRFTFSISRPAHFLRHNLSVGGCAFDDLSYHHDFHINSLLVKLVLLRFVLLYLTFVSVWNAPRTATVDTLNLCSALQQPYTAAFSIFWNSLGFKGPQARGRGFFVILRKITLWKPFNFANTCNFRIRYL